MDSDKVAKFFHHIGPKVLELTNSRFENTKEIRYKDKNPSLNVATEGDFDNEILIVNELAKWFPDDKIVAEETLTETSEINNGNVWIIDPICGSANFKNGIKFFCTNIALARNGKLIASCVVDHSKQNYIWSIGNSKIFINQKLFTFEKRLKGIIVEVDLSALINRPKNKINQHLRLITFLLHQKNYYLSSFCTSLPYAYAALGQINAFVNAHSNAWDVAAANFLITQAGGIVTQVDGNPWTLNSDNVLAAKDKKLHSELLKILNS